MKPFGYSETIEIDSETVEIDKTIWLMKIIMNEDHIRKHSCYLKDFTFSNHELLLQA